MYNAGDVKWGEATLGEPSGAITWNPGDFVDFLPRASGVSVGEINSALDAAFAAWEDVAAVDFVYESNFAAADVTFSTAPLGGTIAGLATLVFEDTPGLSSMVEGNIQFSSNLTWSDYGVGGTDFFAVALHEIGHIIGLDHVNDTSEIMNPTIFADELGDGDIAGAQYLYGTDGDDVPAPLAPSGGGGLAEASGGGGAGVIGLVVGLLALVVGLFSGGVGAAVAVAAGRVASDSDDHEDHDDHEPEMLSDGTMTLTHTSYVPEMPLPMIDFGEPPVAEEELEDAFFI